MASNDEELDQRLRRDLAEARDELDAAAAKVKALIDVIDAAKDVVWNDFVQQALAALPADERQAIEDDPQKMIEFMTGLADVMPQTPTNTPTPDMSGTLMAMKVANAEMDQMISLLELASKLATGLILKGLSPA